MDDLHPGERFAGCRIDAVAGRGGMGVVYQATELALGRRVALKVVAPERAAEEDFTERFGREVRLAAAIDHPNIVPVYGAGEEGGRLYLVMRYVDGVDLHGLLRREGRLEPARAAAIVAQVAAALDAAHAAGLVHRDVKPANVLLAGVGGPGEHVYLTDFGLTVEVSSDTRMTTTGQWIGSVDYMAPEQLRAEEVDARADVYALGGVLYAGLTGEGPFRRTTVPQTIAAHLDEPPPRPSDAAPVDSAFDAVVGRAMAKDPRERYPSAGDLGRAALAAVRGERVTIGERVVARGPAAPASGRGQTPSAVSGMRSDPSALTSHAATRLAQTSHANGRGAALREPAPERPAAAPPAPPPPPAGAHAMGDGDRVRRHRARSRRRLSLALGALVVLALGIAALIGATRAPSPALSAGEVRGAAEDFATAYGDEDARALSRTLARGVQRVAPDGVQRGRSAVLTVYRRQFASDDIRSYELGDVHVVPGEAARASGSYTVRRAGEPDITGRVAFGVVREGGEPRIALISTQPDT